MQRQLNGTFLSRIGIGTWALGGDNWAWGWGPQAAGDSRASIEAAVAAGLNWIDVAPIYGLGHAEAIVGEVVSGQPPQDRPKLFTKCGFTWDSRGRIRHNLRPDSLRAQVEGSLRRLRVDCLDVCQIHWPVGPNGVSACPLDESLGALATLKREGHIARIGICNASSAELGVAFRSGSVDVVQVPYSMVNQGELTAIADVCRGRNLVLLGYSPFESGLLSGGMTKARARSLPKTDWRRHKAESFKEPHLTQALELVDEVAGLAREIELPVSVLILAWTLLNEELSGVIVGLRKPTHVDGVVAALDANVPQPILNKLSTMAAAYLHSASSDAANGETVASITHQ